MLKFPCALARGLPNKMVAAVSNGTCNATNNERQYDAWGGVTYGQGSGDPKGRYCAALGHKQDDESGFVYMRARYEDPATGRFVSEDASKSGWNWDAYATNDPVNRADHTGGLDLWLDLSAIAIVSDIIVLVICLLVAAPLWVVGLCLVLLTAVIVADFLHSRAEDSQDLHKMLDPKMNQIKQQTNEDLSSSLQPEIDQLKSGGGFISALTGENLELLAYTIDAEDA